MKRAALMAPVVVAVASLQMLAVPITFEFSGIVNSVSDPGHDLYLLVAAGNTFSGAYTFESTAPELYPGSYYYVSPVGSTALTVGSLQIEAGATRIGVTDATTPPYSDKYTVSAASDSIIATGVQIVEFFPINFYYPGNAFLTSSDLPLVPPPLPFTDWSFWIQGRGPSGQLFTIRGTVDTLTPEPGAISLLLLGALGVRRRRHIL